MLGVQPFVGHAREACVLQAQLRLLACGQQISHHTSVNRAKHTAVMHVQAGSRSGGTHCIGNAIRWYGCVPHAQSKARCSATSVADCRSSSACLNADFVMNGYAITSSVPAGGLTDTASIASPQPFAKAPPPPLIERGPPPEEVDNAAMVKTGSAPTSNSGVMAAVDATDQDFKGYAVKKKLRTSAIASASAAVPAV